jgi:uncharacterized protein
MKTKNIIWLALSVVVVIVFYSVLSGSNDASYTESIMKERKERDHFMKTSDESPVQDKEKFNGLNYYEPNIKYKIIANLKPVENRNVMVLATNDGDQQRYAEYARAEFVLEGIKNSLLILEVMDMGPNRGKLFLAFGDETSAVETYGAGRYLDVAKVPGSSTITLDFNKAYNPYCAYNESFSCPLPPKENLLKVAIRAGEKNYH